MSQFDSFFENSVHENLQSQVLKNAQQHLEKNRITHRRQKWMAFLLPTLASIGAIIAFRFYKTSDLNQDDKLSSMTQVESKENVEVLTELIDSSPDSNETDLLDIVAEMNMLEDYEYLQSDEDWSDNYVEPKDS